MRGFVFGLESEMIVKINQFSKTTYISFFNNKGMLHREGGPAVVEFSNRLKYIGYYKNGLKHRSDGAAEIYIDLDISIYFLNGKEVKKREFISLIDVNNLFNTYIFNQRFQHAKDLVKKIKSNDNNCKVLQNKR